MNEETHQRPDDALLLRLSNIRYTLQTREILSDVSLDVRRASIVTLIGPNGAGKTTLIRAALGLDAIQAGSVWRRPGLRIGYMPQHLVIPDTLPLTVRRFLCLSPGAGSNFDEAVELAGIRHLLGTPMQGLSGGERQRALLGRALLGRPQLLVLDEPVQGVDVSGQNALYRLIARLRDEQGYAVLMVSHDLHLVMAATDSVVCLNNHVCCSGHPSTVSRHPAYLELFGHASPPELAVYTHHHDHDHDLHGDVVRGEHGHG